MKLLIYFIVFAALFVGYVKYLQAHAVFFPSREIVFTPREAGMEYEEVYFPADDGVNLHGWFIPHQHARLTVLFLHGNGGNIADRVDKLSILHKRGVNVFILDWRGYGKSAGAPSEQGIYRDARAAYDMLVSEKQLEGRRILLYGESLGSAAAIECAASRQVGGVILEGAFSSGQDMARRLYPWIPGFLLKGSYDSINKIARIDAPLLFLHSPEDEIVPYGLARKLFEAAAEPKSFISLQGGHNSLFYDAAQEYTQALQEFIDRIG